MWGPSSPTADCCKAGMSRDLGEQQEIRDPVFPPGAPGKVRKVTGTKQALENEVQKLLWKAQPWLCSEKKESFLFPMNSRG